MANCSNTINFRRYLTMKNKNSMMKNLIHSMAQYGEMLNCIGHM